MSAAGRPSLGSTERPEGVAQLAGEQLRLLPGREVAAPIDLVVVDELRIRPLRPAARRGIQLVREDRDADWDLDALDVEEGEVALPVQASRRDAAVGEPVVGRVLE